MTHNSNLHPEKIYKILHVWLLLFIPQVSIAFLILFLCVYLFGCTGSQLRPVGSSSLTRAWTWAPCIGSSESQPLDHRGSPLLVHSYACVYMSYSVMSDTLRPHGLQSARLLCPWNSPGKNTGVGCHSLLRWIFLTQGLNPGLPCCGQILYCLSHQRILQKENQIVEQGSLLATNVINKADDCNRV